MKGICFLGAIIFSYFINTYFIDNILIIFNIITPLTYLLNRVSLALLIYTICEKNIESIKLVIIYFIFLFGILFGRNIENNIARFNFTSYLPYWLNHLDNKLVLFYLFGNVLIYVPLGLIFRYYKTFKISYFYCFLFIVTIEFLQAMTSLGYFDVDDILLNSIGSIIGIILMNQYLKNTFKDL